MPRATNLIYGVYEYPHGLLAIIIGKILDIPTSIGIISNPNNKNLTLFRKLILNFVIKNANLVTVCGNSSKSFILDNVSSEKKIEILPNSIDTDVFREKKKQKKYDLVTLGRLVPEKRLDLLIKAVYLVKKRYPRIQVAIAGEGHLRNKLISLTKKLKLESNINFLGFSTSPQDIYNSSKIFILTSETEGLPRSMIEAMSCGLPCIVPNVGDISEVAKNKVNSYVIRPYDNIAGYAKAVINLLSNKSTYNNYSNLSKEIVLKVLATLKQVMYGTIFLKILI